MTTRDAYDEALRLTGLTATKPATLAFFDPPSNDPVLSFRFTDGVLCAEYGADRVDEAARVLIEFIVGSHITLVPAKADLQEALDYERADPPDEAAGQMGAS